jgi:hypothetical protein
MQIADREAAHGCFEGSALLKMPPDAAPTYQMFGFPGTPATDVARLPSGPIYRYLSCPYTSGLIAVCWACNKLGATSSTAIAIAAVDIATMYLARLNMLSLSDKNEIGMGMIQAAQQQVNGGAPLGNPSRAADSLCRGQYGQYKDCTWHEVGDRI